MRRGKRSEEGSQEGDTPLLMRLLGQPDDEEIRERAVPHEAEPTQEEEGPPRDHEEVGRRVAAVLNAAEQTAEEIRTEARTEAAQIRGQAESDAAARLEEASQRKAEAEEEARATIAEADTEARATRQAAEKLAQEIEEAARQRQEELRAETRSLEEEKERSLADLRRIADQLRDMLSDTAVGRDALPTQTLDVPAPLPSDDPGVAPADSSAEALRAERG